jgi:hypothetical protein
LYIFGTFVKNEEGIVVWLVGIQAGAITLEKILRLLKNLNIDLTYETAISHSWGYIQRNATQVTPEAPAHPCLLQLYSQ